MMLNGVSLFTDCWANPYSPKSCTGPSTGTFREGHSMLPVKL